MLPVYVDDLVDAILAGLARGAPGEAYAVWDGEPRTFEDHFTRLAAIAGGRAPRRLPRPALSAAARALAAVARVRGEDAAFSPGAITYVDRRGTVSAKRARSELGWEPRVPYDEGMRLTAEWLRTAL
jgi:nucleoside-diphosphate-sugar epimerase